MSLRAHTHPLSNPDAAYPCYSDDNLLVGLRRYSLTLPLPLPSRNRNRNRNRNRLPSALCANGPLPQLPINESSSYSSRPKPKPKPKPKPNPLPVLLASAGFLCCARAFLRYLPSDFPERWRLLLEFAEGAEAKVTQQLPAHLIQAVLASEDRRFFYHFGVDPYGIARAVVHYPNGGGGSTLTQQLVKNVFLTNERKISRKFVEGILSLFLERRMSKWEILYSYLNKMYWGHGKYGIESASLFYFGKHPSDLNVGESALLAGILPSPETLNPFTSPNRGKYSQARALRRMVAAGFLDLETALLIVKQPLSFPAELGNTNEDSKDGRKEIRCCSAIKDNMGLEDGMRIMESGRRHEKLGIAGA
nr:unnamed protein product [Ananas comosus var. bracteatus]